LETTLGLTPYTYLFLHMSVVSGSARSKMK